MWFQCDFEHPWNWDYIVYIRRLKAAWCWVLFSSWNSMGFRWEAPRRCVYYMDSDLWVIHDSWAWLREKNGSREDSILLSCRWRSDPLVLKSSDTSVQNSAKITLLWVIPTRTFQDIYLDNFGHILWHVTKCSIWHIFWQSIWHVFWHFIQHSAWHIFWHSIWHSTVSIWDILSFSILHSALPFFGQSI